MREVLFRGKRADNGEWIEGQLLYFKASVGTEKFALIVKACEWDNSNEWFNLGVRAKVIPETVGQYTGLTDKNGKKIFEGDIVRFPDSEMFPSSEETINEGFVDWDEETMCFYFTNRFVVDMEDFYVDNGKMVDVVVIGNIHDNPELLKGGGEG